MQKFNILFLHSASDLYGSGRILADIVGVLSGIGHSCVICLPEDGPLRKELESRGAKVFIAELGILRRKYLSAYGVFSRLFAMGSAFFSLRRLVKKHSINLIYSNTLAVVVGAIVAKLMNIRHIWHVHEIILSPVGVVKFLAGLLKNCSNLVIVVSTPVKDHWTKYMGKSKLKITVVHNGIDLERVADTSRCSLRQELIIPNTTLIIGMIARVHFWKGQDYFLKLAKKIVEHTRQVRFIMVGDAFPGYEYLYDGLRDQVHKLGLNSYVIDLGFRTDITDILSSFDIFVHPSVLPDPLPTVILEAMSCSKPVVATSHGGALEMVVDGETGILIPWDNEDEAVRRMIPLIDSAGLRKQYGVKAMERVRKHFSMKAFEQNLRSALNSIT